MDYDEAIEWLYGTQLFGIKLGLEGTHRLFEELNLFEALDGRKIIHVAGTNGKGSTCAIIDSICRAAGKRCGLFTSPHLISFSERIRIDGSMIPECETASILTQLRDLVQDWETHPTFFELAVTLAVTHFCQQEVEVLVMETGMGGRLDATNILPSSISVITSVDLDHQQFLGDNLESIASEKAGIIKPGVPLIISSSQKATVLSVLEQTASERSSPIYKISTDNFDDHQKIGLKGPHQRLNAALAVKAVATLWPDLSKSNIQSGLLEVHWPGRFDSVPGNIVIDGAHNPAAVDALTSTWREEFGPDKRATIVFGAADSKEVSTMLSKLASIAQGFVFVKLNAKRGLELAALETALTESEARDIPWFGAANLSEAIQKAKSTHLPILITGSLFLAGESLALCNKKTQVFEPSEQ